VSASAATWALQPWIALRARWPDQPASPSSSVAEAMTVASTSVPVFTVTDRVRSCSLTRSKSTRSSSSATSRRRNRTKAVRSGVGSNREKPQKRRKEVLSSSASASFTSDKSCQTAISSALKSASGGHPASPRSATGIAASAVSTGAPRDQPLQLVERCHTVPRLEPERLLPNPTTRHAPLHGNLIQRWNQKHRQPSTAIRA
jgi:hypothetical protein